MIEYNPPINAWTDYPITELGDIPNKIAPIRKCEIISWDEDKYCVVIVDDIRLSIKRGYLYSKEGRCGMVRGISLMDEKVISSQKYIIVQHMPHRRSYTI